MPDPVDFVETLRRALAMSRDERSAFLARVCGDDLHRRTELEMVLADVDRAAGDAIMRTTGAAGDAQAPQAARGQPPRSDAQTVPAARAGVPPDRATFGRGASEQPGTMVGPYRLLEQIGEGGFGVVYLAEQRAPVYRKVALKILKLGMDTRQIVARFEAERQALAMMSHPHIAKFIDAGQTDSGRPYFVMELVSGVPITEYCDREHLTIDQRLELLMQVCHAVQHAHARGIIHRDLKPGNVLVGTQEGRPVARVIDFGIAKAAHVTLTEKTVFTQQHQLIGTPAYMSPEQAEGSLDIDTRTDVYALGVLLYELLTGTTPFALDQLRHANLSEIQRIIREVDPPRPSTRLLRSTADLPAVAANRRADPQRLCKAIRGELDWIAMKCLSKDRARRYESAGALAADIGRYRAGEAVTAAPPGAGYRLRKFVRKHRAGVASAAVVVVALVAGLGAALIGLRSAQLAKQHALDNERRALDEAKRWKATLQFVSDMFGAIDPALARGHDVTVAEVLDSAAQRVAEAFADQPAAEALVRGVLGEAYARVARYADALRELDLALALHASMGAAEDAEALTVLHNYGLVVLQSGDVERARELLQETCEKRAAILGPAHRDTLTTRSILALVRQLAGDEEGAIADIRALLPDQEEAFGRADRDTIESLCSLADMLGGAGRFEEARAAAHDAADRATEAYGDDSYVALMARSIEAEMLKALARYDEAVGLLEGVVRGKERLYGEGHPDTLISLDLLAGTLAQLDRNEEALELNRAVVDRASRTLGDRHSMTLSYLNNLAQTLRQLRRFDEAEPIYRGVLALRRETDGDRGRDTLIVLSNLGLLLVERGAAAEALPLLREALDGFRETLPADHWMLGVATLNLGRCLSAIREFSEAEATLLESHAILEAALGAQHGRTRAVRKALAALYDAWEKPERAELWRAEPP